MKNYSKHEIFERRAVETFERAVELVKRIPAVDRGGKYWRCHEVTRAVCTVLNGGFEHASMYLRVVDGKFGAVDHTWLVIPDVTKTWPCGAILDVYAVGALPQVQLVDLNPVLNRQYVAGEVRKDIDEEAVDYLCLCMTVD